MGNRLLAVLFLAGCATAPPARPDLRERYARAERFGREMRSKVYKAEIRPRWISGGPRFWYRNDVRGAREFVLVDPEKGTRTVVAAAPGEEAPPAPRPPRPRSSSTRSPDGRWSVEFREFNVVLVAGGEAVPLTKDGTEREAYGGPVRWSPDSRRFVTFRTKKGDERQVQYVESSPKGQLQPRPFTRTYDKPGDAIPAPMPRLFDAEARLEVAMESVLWEGLYDIAPFHPRSVRWSADAKRFTFPYLRRGHQLARLIEVDATTGRARAVIEERTETFIDIHKSWFHFVEGTEEILWMSERDGWNHVYLHDGPAKNPVTRGEWVVRGIDRVDDATRQIWFRGSGRNPGEDPYHVHFYRVNFDGSGLTALTEGDGTHSVQFSPDGRFLIDTWSRADRAPVHDLRRAEDGSKVLRLEEADIADLQAAGWRAPEPFRASGRDGKTDIWGLLHRPADFDPARKYPVIEHIYAGPQGAHVPKAFFAGGEEASLAQLGFVVVQIDGMGTSNRSRAFHHFCWKNLKDAGLPDRIAWMRAAAERYPQLDLGRVGIYGHSAGGQNALGGLLFHGDFYKAGVASCGCHDNRMDKLWWNEQWMGYPVGPHYAENSNVTHAAKLRGQLLLVVGELDTNVDPSSTMQVVNALVKAGKDFELLVVPGAGHGGGGSYERRRRWDFFLRHLQGLEPPDWNRSS
jgi:dipeptidyl aminopeptidase/acylaminoacyl peptidase